MPGQKIAQSCHVAFVFSQEHMSITKNWMNNSNFICVLENNNLNSLIEKAKYYNISFSIFKEPDLDYQITAIALAPGSMTKKICSSLKLALK